MVTESSSSTNQVPPLHTISATLSSTTNQAPTHAQDALKNADNALTQTIATPVKTILSMLTTPTSVCLALIWSMDAKSVPVKTLVQDATKPIIGNLSL